MTALVRHPPGLHLHGRPAVHRSAAMPRHDDRGPCRSERVIEFALCLILAVAVIGLLLLAL